MVARASGWAMRTRAPESASRWASSRSLYIGLTGTTVAPSFQAASTASTQTGVFCSETATRSPEPTPRFSMPAASASLRRSVPARSRVAPK